MQKRWPTPQFLSLLFFALCLPGCTHAPVTTFSRPASFQAKNIPQLYPLHQGWQWVYQTRQKVGDGPERPGAEHRFTIVECSERGGKTEAVMERRYGNFQAPSTLIERTEDEVRLSRYGQPEQGSITVLRFPLSVGKSWPGRQWEQAKEIISFLGTESIDVPAGRYLGHHLEHRIEYQNGRTDRLHYWYAPGVGLVKAVEGLTVDLGQGPQYREVTTDLAELKR